MFIFIAATLLLASVDAKFYTDCGSKLATVKSVGVSGCADDAKECILKRNTNSTITIDFTPAGDVKELNTEVHGVIMGLPVPFPLPQPDACKDSGISCPLKVWCGPSKDGAPHYVSFLPSHLHAKDLMQAIDKGGQLEKYRATLPVLKSYPKVSVHVKWELKSESGDLVCVLIAAKIN